jgi:hypothetical protein
MENERKRIFCRAHAEPIQMKPTEYEKWNTDSFLWNYGLGACWIVGTALMGIGAITVLKFVIDWSGVFK